MKYERSDKRHHAPRAHQVRSLVPCQASFATGLGLILLVSVATAPGAAADNPYQAIVGDRKSTRLKLQSRFGISYAVFCLKKKKNSEYRHTHFARWGTHNETASDSIP